MYVVSILAPVFLIMALGAVLYKTSFLSPDLTFKTNRLVYWLALPCLLFNKTADADIPGGSALRIFVLLSLVAIACITLAYLFGCYLQLGNFQQGAFVQASFRGNLAFVGLPIVTYALQQMPNQANLGNLETIAVLSFVPTVPIYNLAAVIVLLVSSGQFKGSSLVTVAQSLLSNPLIIACLIGLTWSVMGLPFPLWLDNTTETLGEMALPLALLGIGVSLVASRLGGGLGLASLAAIVKVLIGPILGWVLMQPFSLSASEQMIALLYMACPTATASYVMAEQMGSDGILTSNAIVFSTLLSAIALTVILVICL